jgi:hypothetical protein
LRIGFDVDGVLANFTRGYANLIREVSGRDLLTDEDIARPKSWYWDREAGYTKEEETAAWDFIQSSADFWETLEPLPGMADIQNILSHNDVYFISDRRGIQPKSQTEGFLYNNLPFGSTPTVLISGNKGPLAVGLGLDFFVDDRDKNLFEVKAASPRTRCYVLDYPYNQNVTGDIATRVSSVAQVFAEYERVV